MLAGEECGQGLLGRGAGEPCPHPVGEAGMTTPLPCSMPTTARRATSAAANHMNLGSEFSDSSSVKPADSANSVFTGPGHSTVTVTPVPVARTSARTARL